MHITCACKLEDHLHESILSLYCVGPKDQSHVFRLGEKSTLLTKTFYQPLNSY